MDGMDARALAERAEDLLRIWASHEEPDPAGLQGVIDLLRQAVDADPSHPDHPWWMFSLGFAYLQLSEDQPDHWSDAVTWLWRAAHGPVHPGIDPDHHLEMLATALFYRCLRQGAGRVELTTLLAELATIPRMPIGSSTDTAFAYYSGIAYLLRASDEPEQADAKPDPDVELGIGLLSRALPAVDDDDQPMLEEALVLYAQACAETGRHFEAAAAVTRGRRLPYADGEQLDLIEALLLSNRYDDTQGPRDRDALITLLDRLTATDGPLAEDATSLALHGNLLGDRGAEADSTADLARAARSLERALDLGADQPAALWLMLSLLHAAWAEMGRDQHRMQTAAEYAATALRYGPAHLPADETARAHLVLVLAADSRLRTSSVDTSAVASMQTVLANAHRACGASGLDADTSAELSFGLASFELSLAFEHPNGFNADRCSRLLDAASSHPEPPEDWDTNLMMARSRLSLVLAMAGDGPRLGAPFSTVDLLSVLRRTKHPEAVLPHLASILFLRGINRGDRALLASAAELARHLEQPSMRVISAHAEFLLAVDFGRGRLPEIRAALDRLVDVAESAAAEPDGGWVEDHVLPWCRAIRAMVNQQPVDGAQMPPSVTASNPVLASAAGLTSVLRAIPPLPPVWGDADRRLAVLHEIDRAVAALPKGRADRSASATIVSAFWTAHATKTGDRGAARRAVRWADESLAFLDGPMEPTWAAVARNAAAARRARGEPGDRRRSRELGLSALRGHAWHVLQQPVTAHGLAAARGAAAAALQVAGWCVEDAGHHDKADATQAAEDLVAALEAGRGLVLHAATTSRTVAEQLVDLGHAELAAEWTAGGGVDRVDLGIAAGLGVELHGDLRRRVLTTLVPAFPDLLDPPSLAEVQAALRAHGSDALIYLVPGDPPSVDSTDHSRGGDPSPAGPTQSGLAVIVPAVGTVELVELPGLHTGPGTPLAAYTQAYAAWHGGQHRPDPERKGLFATWRTALGNLTAWAGRVAVDPILATTHRWAPDPTRPRLSLTPIGALGLVPWHAARTTAQPPGPAPQPSLAPNLPPVLAARAIVSYVPSARLLRQAVARASAANGAVLLVGNPAGDPSLKAMSLETQALHSVFYPDATVLGRTPGVSRQTVCQAGAGTAADLLAWLRGDAPRRVLHLGCHGHAEPDNPTRSRLGLADKPLTIAELLADQPSATTPVDRVFLSACMTNVTGSDHDEAFSIATAFLAAGARTAYGSLWPIPATFTVQITFMIHHYLEHEGLPPADALHHAQIWALDPDRTAPSTMPPKIIGIRPHGYSFHDPIAWAGLIHLGA
ncbi:CHAT domain-containing protein [Parafrankia sp. FMc6]|uniref:CHAT domain-containing tetratricopeptide repeat protein n=1 Tax=Parafrankia soli TaxID=2599596 RepID=UPI0034D68B7B